MACCAQYTMMHYANTRWERDWAGETAWQPPSSARAAAAAAAAAPCRSTVLRVALRGWTRAGVQPLPPRVLSCQLFYERLDDKEIDMKACRHSRPARHSALCQQPALAFGQRRLNPQALIAHLPPRPPAGDVEVQ